MQQGSEIKLNLNKNLYELSSIKQVIKQFKNICDMTLKEEEGYFNITLKPKNNSLSLSFADEFANYVLALMKNKSLV